MSLVRIVLVFLCAVFTAQAQPPTLVVYGDSLSAGYGLPRGAGWVDLLGERLRQRGYPHTVVNASISGETSTGGKNRIAKVLQQLKPTVVILELGANDGLRGQPNAQLHANLSAIIESSKKHAAKVLLIGMRIPPNYGAPYAREFESTFTMLAKHHKLAHVPFLMEGFAHRPELFQPDGLHPAQAAQGLMLDSVWKALEGMLKHSPAKQPAISARTIPP